MRSFNALLIAVCLFFVANLDAKGGIIRFNFEAKVRDVEGDSKGSFEEGQTITGFFEYETTLPDLDPGADQRGLFRPVRFDVNSTNFDFTDAFAEIELLNGPPADQFIVRTGAAVATNPGFTSAELLLINNDGTAFPTANELPSSLPPLSAFQTATLQLSFGSGEGGAFNVIADITALTPGDAVIPEPATITMLGFGAVGLAGFAWGRKKRAA